MIIDLPTHRLAELIRKKKLTSVEVVSAFIEQIEKVNPKINAVVAFRPKEALREAKKADQELKAGKIRGPLHGVPCTIKDSFDTKGIVSTGGTLGRKNFLPTQNASAVQKLIDAGAIILGKTNTPEITMSFDTDNLVYGKTKNPLDLKRTSGGSSGGAAAIVAAKGSPFDLGTDTGGSIRWPAHACGIAGLKSTAGRVSKAGHIIDFKGLSESLTCVGPLAKSVDELEFLYSIIAEKDGIDPFVVDMPKLDPKKVKMKTLRGAFYTHNGLTDVSDETVKMIAKVVSVLKKGGLKSKKSIPDDLINTPSVYLNFLCTGDWMKRLLEEAGTIQNTLPWVNQTPDPTSSEYNKIIERTSQFRSKMLAFWNDFDVLICPVAPSEAPEFGTAYNIGTFHSYTSAYNVAGWPSLTVRAGTAKSGMPLGIQIIAAPFREDICLAVGKFLETKLGYLNQG